MRTYELDKNTWTEEDFEVMGWHDSKIYGLTISKNGNNEQNDLTFDIDYIFQWIKPAPRQKHFTFQVAPCTLVFHNVSDLDIDISTGLLLEVELEVDDIHKKIGRSENLYNFKVLTQQGEIKFEATGYTQYVRKHPKHIEGQMLSMEDRGGISFDRVSVCN